MTLAEALERIKVLEEHRRRWFNRAWRLHDAIEEKDAAWAARIVEGWEHDGEERCLLLSRAEVDLLIIDVGAARNEGLSSVDGTPLETKLYAFLEANAEVKS